LLNTFYISLLINFFKIEFRTNWFNKTDGQKALIAKTCDISQAITMKLGIDGQIKAEAGDQISGLVM
jgi:hypothetical protein